MNTDKLVRRIVLGFVVSWLTAAAPSQAAVNPILYRVAGPEWAIL